MVIIKQMFVHWYLGIIQLKQLLCYPEADVEIF